MMDLDRIMEMSALIFVLFIFVTITDCQVTSECGGNLTGDSGVISLASCPDTGKEYELLRWNIYAPKQKVIRLTTDYINMNMDYEYLNYKEMCKHSYLKVTSGGEVPHDIGIYCHILEADVVSPNNTLAITFKGNKIRNKFSLKYHFQNTSVGCEEEYFKCPFTGRCLSSHFICDGNNDCGDDTDEQNCPSAKTHSMACGKNVVINKTGGSIISHRLFNQSVYPSGLSCSWKINAPPGKYIRLWSEFIHLDRSIGICDDFVAVYDGNNGEDSMVGSVFCNTEINFITTGDTAIVKFETDNSWQGLGFDLRYRFQDSNECGDGFIKCDTNNLCIKTLKICDTFDDCGDMTDERNCDYMSGIYIPWMLLSSETSVKVMTIQNNVTNVSIVIQEAKVKDISYGNSSIVWARDNMLYKTAYNSSTGIIKNTKIMREDDDHVYSVAVDWITENVYWSTRKNIKVTKYNGEFSCTLIGTDAQGIAVDSFERLLVWRAQGRGCIKTMSMNGDLETENIITRDLHSYVWSGIALDIAEKMVYFVDGLYFSGSIVAINYQGNFKRHLVSLETFTYPVSISCDKESLFWITNKQVMYTIDTSGKNYHRLPVNGVTRLNMFNDYRHEGNINPCENNGCEQLCLLSMSSYQNYTCECADGHLKLKENSCTEDPCFKNKLLSCKCLRSNNYYSKRLSPSVFSGIADALIISETCEIAAFSFSHDSFNRTQRIHTSGYKVSGYVDFDPITNTLYWTEGMHAPIIRRAKYGKPDSSETVLNETKEMWLCGIAIDWIARHLYWCVYSARKIKGRSLNMNNENGEFLIVNPKQYIRSMTVDIFHGHIYWSTWEPNGSIYRVGVNGRGINLITRHINIGEPYSLTVDYVSRKLFYYIENKGVASVDVDVVDITSVLYLTREKTTALTIFDDYVYAANEERVFALKKFTNATDAENKILLHGFLDINGLKAIKLKTADIEPKCQPYERCWGANGSWICIDNSMICDGKPDCFGHTDEMYCNLCEDNCTSGVLKIHCDPIHRPYFPVADISRFPEAILSEFIGWNTHPFSQFIKLKDFYVAGCSIYFQYFDGLKELNKTIDFPMISSIQIFRIIIKSNLFRNTKIVNKLILSGLLKLKNLNQHTFAQYRHISDLTIYNTSLSSLPERSISYMSNIKNLNVSYNRLSLIHENALLSLTKLEMIDIRGNDDLKLASNIFKDNENLRIIYSDSYAFCCVKPIKPKSAISCYAPQYDVSSCTDLIQDSVLRAFLWLIGIFAFVGNLGGLIYRLFIEKSSKGTFTLFVNHLSLADAIMGFYLLIVAVYDTIFRGSYAWNDNSWRESAMCKFCGILSLVSSEASVVFVCFITLDRYLAVKYPFGGPRLTKTHTHILCITFWFFVILLAVVPMFPYKQFYSSSGICIALPITSFIQDGHTYSVVIFLGLNFVLFCILGIGQILILREIVLSAKLASRRLDKRDRKVAVMLAWVFCTDLLCWIPIGIMVALALSGVFIAREMYAWIVVFVLPINSALNPFIYTFSGVINAMAGKCTRYFRNEHVQEVQSVVQQDMQSNNLNTLTQSEEIGTSVQGNEATVW